MYGIYGDIVVAAERALERFDETKELLEYPEVQADKAYYLSVLSQYNNLKLLKDRLSALLSDLKNEKEIFSLLSEAKTEEERTAVYAEISSLKRSAALNAAALSDALGGKHVNERAYCEVKCRQGSAKICAALFSLIKAHLISHGAKIEQENTVTAKEGYVQKICFTASGADVVTRLIPLAGAHKVYLPQAKSEELCLAVTSAATAVKIEEDDLKIDVFHSGGAGGQNINKVETAIRVTHVPTGLSVVCQDERSQLSNKKRALQTIEKRLKDMGERAEKERIEADVRAQFSKKNTPIAFDAACNTMTDTRLKAFYKIPFPLTQEQFTAYVNGLIAL